MTIARSGRWAVTLGGLPLLACINAAQALPPPPTSLAPTTRYEYDAMGHVTKILRGESGDSTAIGYDRLYRITSITDARRGTTRFEYNGGIPGVAKVIDPRGLQTVYERNGFGEVMRRISPDTGITEFTYGLGGRVQTVLDSRGVLTSLAYGAGGRLAQLAASKNGQADPVLTWTYDETGPDHTYGIGRLTSTSHGAGGSGFSYDPRGRVTVQVQRVDPMPGANAAAIELTVRHGYEHGDRTSITYPSGRKLKISRTMGEVTALSLAENGAGSPVPVISALKWAPFGMDIEGWAWHTRNGLVPHERSFDLSGRITRHPIGKWVRDVRYDAQDRIESFTHWLPDGTPQPALDQQFGYDENDRLTSVVTASASWAISYDPNSNRASLSLDGSPSTYNTASTSNRLRDVSNPARSLAYDPAGNTTSESGGYVAGYNLAGQLTTLTKAGITTTYSYDNDGRRIRKFSITGLQSTVIFVYDIEGQLLGEYDHQGRAIREYIWLDDVPVAMFMPDPANAAGPPLIFHIHADHLNAPRAVFDTDGVLRWQWLAEPFGTTAPEGDPSGRGPFVFNLRFPGQYADAESGLFYNWTRYYDPRDGRYTQSDSIGLAGGSLSTYAYIEGNPVSYIDPTGEFAWGIVFGGADLAWQLYQNGGNLKCVNWGEVGLSMLGGGFLNALGKGAFRFKTAGSHTWNATRSWMNRRGIQTPGAAQQRHHWLLERNQGVGKNVPDAIKNQPFNTNPISAQFNNWLSRRPGLAWMGGPSWAGEVAAGVAMTSGGSDDCTCER